VRVALLTVGDTGRRTGGYLYNARLCAGLRERDVAVDELSLSGASPEEQQSAKVAFDPSPYDALVVDALARIAVAPHLDRWRRSTPAVALVHELPSAAGSGVPDEARYEEPLLRAERLVAVSDHGRSVLEGRGVPPERVRVVPPGCDRLGKASGFGAQVSGGSPPDPVALCVAQWVPRKGILTLVEAWKRLEPAGAELVLAGEPDADPEYAAAVRAAIGEDAGVRVAGAVPDAELESLYAAADLFVLPSRYEGYGMVYAEALSCGLPVVACEVGPVPELVGPAGLLVPPDDPAALAAALERLLNGPELRRRLAEDARRRVAELPRWGDTVAGFLAVLREVGR
jgi:glycosyltransferase involved in cell wall biosynthesis